MKGCREDPRVRHLDNLPLLRANIAATCRSVGDFSSLLHGRLHGTISTFLFAHDFPSLRQTGDFNKSDLPSLL